MFQRVFKMNPNHDALGRFASASSRVGGGSLTSAEVDALNSYAGDGHDALNYDLRHGEPADSKLLDSAFSKSSLAEELMVYRGTALPDSITRDLRPGATFEDKGFVSTSKDPQYLDNNWRGNLYRLTIQVPKGTKAIDMNKVKGSGRPTENEVLLDRGLTYRVLAVDGKKVTVRVES